MERTLWEGKIRLVETETEDEVRVTFDYEFDLDELMPQLRMVRSKYDDGDAIVGSMVYALIGMLEGLKQDLLCLLDDIKR